MPKPPCRTGRLWLAGFDSFRVCQISVPKNVRLQVQTFIQILPSLCWLSADSSGKFVGNLFACKNGIHHWGEFFVFQDARMCSSVLDCNAWFVTQLGWHELVECAKHSARVPWNPGSFTNWDPWNTKVQVNSKPYKNTKKLARTNFIHFLFIRNLQVIPGRSDL